MIKEWNLLRTIACLSIVLLHSTTHIGRVTEYPQIDYYHIFRVVLCFATPTFIVLSEIILANKYKNELPSDFFKRRLKLIMGPFITFAIVDTLITNYLSVNDINISEKLFDNLLGNYEGYFILIIFQFYILHFLIIRFRISVEKLLPLSIVIMIIHLYLLNSNITFINENKNFFKLLFTAWFGYFSVAFLIGKYYKNLIDFLLRWKWITIILVFFSVYLIFTSYSSGNTAINSRRIDIFPLSITISLTILIWGRILPNFKIVNLISNYSLGIYLLHWQVQRVISQYIADIFNHTSTRVLALFIISLTISMLIMKLVSLLPFGKYLVGNIKRNFNKKVIPLKQKKRPAN